ncbi:MAG: hypothetical protein WBP49_13245, partial [Acidimicrobiia bacterium]
SSSWRITDGGSRDSCCLVGLVAKAFDTTDARCRFRNRQWARQGSHLLRPAEPHPHHDQDPRISGLIDSDGTHPSPTGNRLTANTLTDTGYETATQE